MRITWRRAAAASSHRPSFEYSLARPYQIISLSGWSRVMAAKASMRACDMAHLFLKGKPAASAAGRNSERTGRPAFLSIMEQCMLRLLREIDDWPQTEAD